LQELLSRSHYASNEIKDKLMELTDKRNGMIHRYVHHSYFEAGPDEIMWALVGRLFF
jgi:hypothetical protein